MNQNKVLVVITESGQTYYCKLDNEDVLLTAMHSINTGFSSFQSEIVNGNGARILFPIDVLRKSILSFREPNESEKESFID